MGDWNTLHFLNDKYFTEKVVPDLLGNGNLLKKYFEAELSRCMFFDNSNAEQRISNLTEFFRFLEKDFKKHKTLLAILNREKKPGEPYLESIQKRYQEEKAFIEKHGTVISDLTYILPHLLFSECAAFNPHLILGRRIFTNRVDAKPGSVAAEIIPKIIHSESGCIYSQFGEGIINWVTQEELELLWLDRDNIISTNKEAEDYFNDFIKFIETALQNNLGVISVTNVKEYLLKTTKNPIFTIEFNVEESASECIINYE